MYPRFLISVLPVFAVFVSTDSSPSSDPSASSPSSTRASSRLLLVSFDGFRHDYLEKTSTPNFDRLVQSGVRAKWVKDAFITKTFPNHFTIVTGLYEESHGIVANNFYDPSLNETFNMSSVDPKWWSVGAEPIWVTDRLQKPQAQSGIYFWPGSEGEIKGVSPTYFEKYNSSVPMRERIDTVVSWFKNYPSFNLGLLYYHEPDRTAHRYGPNSDEVAKKIRKCDYFVGYLLDRLEENGLASNLNLIVTSDHGFAELVNPSSTVVLERILGPKGLEFEAFGSSPALGVWPKHKSNRTAVKLIYEALKEHPVRMSVYLKKDIPSAFHYASSSRIAPILVLADLGYGVVADEKEYKFYNSKRRGEHGYDNGEMDMHPFFVAKGPAFKSDGFVSEPFHNVDIYPFMCLILGLKPAPNNGSLDKICSLSTLPNCRRFQAFGNFGLWALTVTGLGLCGLVAVAYVVVSVRRRRRQRATLETPMESRAVEIESAATAVRWDEEDDCQVESLFPGADSRVSKWRKWSRNWKRKWVQLRHARGGDEGESLLMDLQPSLSKEAIKKGVEDPLDHLPDHLADALRR